MEKTSKVKEVVKTNRTWTNPEGKDLQILEIYFENEDMGETFSEKFKVGEEATYSFEETKWGNKIKFVDKNKFQAKKTWQPKSEDQMKLETRFMITTMAGGYAKDVVCALIAKSNEKIDGKMSSQVFESLYETIYTKMIGKL